jgi:hypothetical protein
MEVTMKKGDLIKNIRTGQFAVVLSTYTRFFQDRSHWGSDVDYGVADTAVEIKWMECGTEYTFQRSKMKRNWEVVSCK